jgi:aconitate hydratase
MGAELGATTSIFPSDERTRQFLAAQGREEDYTELKADDDAVYAAEYTVNLSELKPLAACPHSPDNVKSIDEIGGIKIDQVCIGSCTNSSLEDMLKVAHILKGKTVNENVSLAIAPGSKQVYTELARRGAIEIFLQAGARILESACGPCIGMGLSPGSNGVSLRTFNRNFLGRSGTKSAQIYLVSPETAAISAVTGVLTNPVTLGEMPAYAEPEHFIVNDNMIVSPAEDGNDIEVVRGPNIKPFPVQPALAKELSGEVLLKTEDNITTDHIMPAGAKILPLRSNIPAISEYCFTVVDETFPARAKKLKDTGASGFIIGGENYGQGSSREHAALAPVYLGIKAVICKSFARIHKQNLINNGIIPLTFVNPADYDKIRQGDKITLPGIRDCSPEGIIFVNNTQKYSAKLNIDISERDRKMLKAGGLLNLIKQGEQI